MNFDFIEAHGLTWIDNLITGTGKNLASPSHPNHYLPYVQEYIAKYGVRKCEANAIVVIPDIARELYRRAIESYLGTDALERFEAKKKEIEDILCDFRERTGLKEVIKKAIKTIEEDASDKKV